MREGAALYFCHLVCMKLKTADCSEGGLGGAAATPKPKLQKLTDWCFVVLKKTFTQINLLDKQKMYPHMVSGDMNCSMYVKQKANNPHLL